MHSPEGTMSANVIRLERIALLMILVTFGTVFKAVTLVRALFAPRADRSGFPGRVKPYARG
jgi:hypothetical protein